MTDLAAVDIRPRPRLARVVLSDGLPGLLSTCTAEITEI